MATSDERGDARVFELLRADRGDAECPPADLEAVRADDELVEALRAGCVPLSADPIVRLLTAWRDDTCRRDIA